MMDQQIIIEEIDGCVAVGMTTCTRGTKLEADVAQYLADAVQLALQDYSGNGFSLAALERIRRDTST